VTVRSIRTSDPVSHLLQLQTSLIYHTVFGDRDGALRIASEIEEIASRSELSWYSINSRRNCFLARQLVGDGRSEYEQLAALYSECLEASMTMTALRCSSLLTSILIDDGHIDEARKWMRESEKLAGVTNGAALPSDYLSAEVDLALIDGNCLGAHAHITKMQENGARHESGRLRNELLIYRLRVEQVCEGTPVREEDLAPLLSFHYMARHLGRHDDHMDVLWVALNSIGRCEQASALLAEYLYRHRRERRSCRHFLRMRTKADPAWHGVAN
jgi:hypothetical protein